MTNQIFPASVQTQVQQAVTIDTNKVKELVNLAVAGKEVEYTWNGETRTRPVDSNCLRHRATNYNSITASTWYKELKKQYGEAIHLLLKVYINNQINNYVVSCIGYEFASTSQRTRAVIEELHGEIDALHYEMDGLRNRLEQVELKLEESEIKNFDLEVEVHQLQKATSNYEMAFNKGMEAMNKFQEIIDMKTKIIEVTAEDLELTKKTLEVTNQHLNVVTVKLEETQIELAEAKVEIVDTKQKLNEVSDRLTNVKQQLDTFMSKDWALNITSSDVTTARQMLGNGIRDAYLITADLTEEVEEATSESASVTLDTVEEVQELIEEMVEFIYKLKPFTTVDVEHKLLDSLKVQCYNMHRRLLSIVKVAHILQQLHNKL